MPAVALAGEVIKETGHTSFASFLNGIKNYLLGFVGALVVLVIVYGGFQYITSGGDPEKAKAAKRTLTYAVMGLIFIITAEVILSVLNNSVIEIFGSDKYQM